MAVYRKYVNYFAIPRLEYVFEIEYVCRKLKNSSFKMLKVYKLLDILSVMLTNRVRTFGKKESHAM